MTSSSDEVSAPDFPPRQLFGTPFCGFHGYSQRLVSAYHPPDNLVEAQLITGVPLGVDSFQMLLGNRS